MIDTGVDLGDADVMLTDIRISYATMPMPYLNIAKKGLQFSTGVTVLGMKATTSFEFVPGTPSSAAIAIVVNGSQFQQVVNNRCNECYSLCLDFILETLVEWR